MCKARELGVKGGQLNAVKQAFDAHGIVPGWEKALGVDTDTLIDKVNITGTGVGAGGGRFAVSQSDDEGGEPYSVWAGYTNGKGGLKQISGNNGNYNVYADTDGKTVVWAEFAADAIHLKARPIAGGPGHILLSDPATLARLRSSEARVGRQRCERRPGVGGDGQCLPVRVLRVPDENGAGAQGDLDAVVAAAAAVAALEPGQLAGAHSAPRI